MLYLLNVYWIVFHRFTAIFQYLLFSCLYRQPVGTVCAVCTYTRASETFYYRQTGWSSAKGWQNDDNHWRWLRKRQASQNTCRTVSGASIYRSGMVFTLLQILCLVVGQIQKSCFPAPRYVSIRFWMCRYYYLFSDSQNGREIRRQGSTEMQENCLVISNGLEFPQLELTERSGKFSGIFPQEVFVYKKRQAAE